MNLTVRIDADLADRLRAGAAQADRLMLDGLVDIGDQFVSSARRLAKPGRFAASFGSRVVGDDTVVAGSMSPLASILEKGRKPGRRPPISRRITPAAAERIGRQGTKGQFTVKRAAAQIRDDGTVERVARRVVERIANP